jgi:hypothetical protein
MGLQDNLQDQTQAVLHPDFHLVILEVFRVALGHCLRVTAKKQSYYEKETEPLLIYDLNSKKMVQWWKDFRENRIPYHITNNNCAVVVYKALCKGNERFKDDQHAKTPEKVFELVKAYIKNRLNKNAVKESVVVHYILLVLL